MGRGQGCDRAIPGPSQYNPPGSHSPHQNRWLHAHQQDPQEQQSPHGVCLLVQPLAQESRSIELVKGP